VEVAFGHCRALVSLPARGEWIEINIVSRCRVILMSLPARGEWIEINIVSRCRVILMSLPARGEWIEMVFAMPYISPHYVSPRTGRVD